ncbi:hypothetical protein [Emticicia sp. SJ17W-69]|uniref:hypothetical protein n=1 Tax=Emticicia sp. SJ17W-69 TaxID=3421657 RepID=UPI003EBA12E0
MTDERIYIEQCKELIESQLSWGKSATWQNQDFEELSERIFEKTKVSLSSSTLKRIWGKVKYDSSPNLATLNALAQFVGYESWREFRNNGGEKKKGFDDEIIIKIKPKSIFKKFQWSFLIVFCLGLIGILWAFQRQEKKLEFSNIHFTSKSVTLGVPNTVIFEYNAVNSNADSVFIQQSWDPKRRYKVDKNLHEYTSTYYTPGYFRAKLILNDSIVKDHDLFIESDGWLGTLETEKIPIYFHKNQIQKGNVVGISEADLRSQNIDLQTENIWTDLHNISTKNVVNSNAFVMETELRNTFSRSSGVCKQSRILLLGSEGIIAIPLSIKGCVGELKMTIADEEINGKTHNLSAFGVDYSTWVKVKCVAKNQKIQIYINDVLAYQSDYTKNIGKIVGTRIRFMGTGEVKRFELKL